MDLYLVVRIWEKNELLNFISIRIIVYYELLLNLERIAAQFNITDQGTNAYSFQTNYDSMHV